jgi:hypothetical protein
VEANRARIFQSGLKTGGGATWMVHVTSLRRSREDQVENRRIDASDCTKPCYLYFAIFYILDPKGILII